MNRPADPVCLVGSVVIALMIAAMTFAAVDARSGPARATIDDPVGSLVEAWARSRSATYRSTGAFERSAPDGRAIAADVEIVQRPPDRLLRQFGEVSGRRGERVLRCPAPIGGGALECTLGPPGESFDATVAAEVASFRALVAGADPLYDIARRSADCWRMTRTRNDPRSGFGLQTDLCTDPVTGAVRSIETDHGEITERTVYDEISAEVADADLEP